MMQGLFDVCSVVICAHFETKEGQRKAYMKILPTIMPKKWFNDELDSEVFSTPNYARSLLLQQMYTQGKSMKQFKFSPEEYNKNFL